jgi:NADH:ubiquinone oxidoreductase subunit H
MGDNLFDLYLILLKPFNEAHLFLDTGFLSETLFAFVKDSFWYSYSTNYTFIFTTKLALCLVFLSAIRGGVPRYRYDFLTKMGWVKFLGLVLAVFLSSFSLFIIW